MGATNMIYKNIKPTFLIIGVQKGGTTSLHEYLLQHENLISPSKKELHFFDTNEQIHFSDYNKFFPRRFFNDKISFESTPRYLYFPNTAKKIYNYNPNMKFIVMIRNPVERAYSAWNMYKQFKDSCWLVSYFKKLEKKDPTQKIYSLFYNNSFPSFEDYVNLELDNKKLMIEPSILKRGYYSDQLIEYYKYFNKENFLFIDSDNFRYNVKRGLESVTTFLKIKNFNTSNIDTSLKHVRKYDEQIDSEIYDYLLNHFQEKNKYLFELTGVKFNWLK